MIALLFYHNSKPFNNFLLCGLANEPDVITVMGMVCTDSNRDKTKFESLHAFEVLSCSYEYIFCVHNTTYQSDVNFLV